MLLPTKWSCVLKYGALSLAALAGAGGCQCSLRGGACVDTATALSTRVVEGTIQQTTIPCPVGATGSVENRDCGLVWVCRCPASTAVQP